MLNFNESNNIISFDIEAYLEKKAGCHKIKEFVPYACGWYNGSNAKTYYLTDFQNSVEKNLDEENKGWEREEIWNKGGIIPLGSTDP